VEAAGCGTVPIITAQCGAAEVLTHGVHCIKINRNTNELARAMQDVMDNKYDLVKMGLAGKHLAETDLSHGKYIEDVEVKLKEHAKPWSQDRLNDCKLPMLMYIKHNLAQRIYGTKSYQAVSLQSLEIQLLKKVLKRKYRTHKILQFLTFGLVKNFQKLKEKYRKRYRELA
jgi:hypothetical protein